MSSMVKVFHETHGLFTIEGDRFVERLTAIVSSVNYDAKAHRMLQAALTEMTDINFFDADLALIVAMTLEVGWNMYSVNFIMSDKDDALWLKDIESRFAYMPSF